MQDRTEQLLDYVHGRLDDAGRAEVEALLGSTPELQADLAAIEAVQAEMAVDTAALAPSQAERAAGWRQLSAAIEAERARVPANDNRRFSLLQVAAVAAVAVIGTQMLSYTLRPSGEAGFVPASVTAEALVLQVAFRQEARVDEITELLRALDVTIVDGPSAMGLLTLQFSDEAARDAALSALRERTDVVEIVSAP